MVSSLIGLGLAGTKQARELIQRDWFLDKLLSEYFLTTDGWEALNLPTYDKTAQLERRATIRAAMREVLKISRLPPGLGQKIDARAALVGKLRKKRHKQQKGQIPRRELRRSEDRSTALRRFKNQRGLFDDSICRAVRRQFGRCESYPKDGSNFSHNRVEMGVDRITRVTHGGYRSGIYVNKRWLRDVYLRGLCVLEEQFVLEAEVDPAFRSETERRFVVRYIRLRVNKHKRQTVTVRTAFVRQDNKTRKIRIEGED